MTAKTLAGSFALLLLCAVSGCSSDSDKAKRDDAQRADAAEREDAGTGGGDDAGRPAASGGSKASAANGGGKGGSSARDAGPSDAGGGKDEEPGEAKPEPDSQGDVPCEVATVLQDHCVACHGRVLQQGAPISLVDAEDFERDLGGYTAGKAVLMRVADDARPMPPPPARRLSASEIEKLQGWIDDGAKPAAKGCTVDTSAPASDAGAPDGGGVVVVTPRAGRGADDLDAGPSPDAAVDGGGVPEPVHSSWPTFGFDLANSRNNTAEQTLNAGTVGNLQELWRFNGPSTSSTPAVVDGIVYLPGWDGRVYARRLDDGSEVWTASLPDLIDSSPTVTSSRVFLSDDDGSVHALSRDSGELLWSRRVDDHEEAHLWSSPVYIPSANLLVVGVASGEEQVPKAVYTFRGSVVGLAADSGEIRWRVETASSDEGSGPGIGVWGTAAVDEARKLVFIGTGNNYGAPSGRLSDSLLAINYDSGELVWSKQFTSGDTYTIYGSQGPDFDIGSSANLFSVDGRELVGIGVKSGNYYALDRDSGSVAWMTPITAGAVLGGVISASAYADGLIFVASNTFALSSSTAVAIDARNGDIIWRHDLSNLTYAGVAHAQGVVYVGTTSGSIYALDGATGNALWVDQTPGSQPIAGGPTVADGRLLVPWGYQWTLREGNSGSGGMTVYGL